MTATSPSDGTAAELAPFDRLYVQAAGEHSVHFVVGVQPAFWSQRGEDIQIEKQRQFIEAAIREKIQKEQQK